MDGLLYFLNHSFGCLPRRPSARPSSSSPSRGCGCSAASGGCRPSSTPEDFSRTQWGRFVLSREDSYSHLTSATRSLGHYSAHLLCYRRVRRAEEVHAVRDTLVERVHARCAPLHHGSCAAPPLRLRVAGPRPCAAVLRVCLPHGVPDAGYCHTQGQLLQCAHTVLCSARRPPLSCSPRQGGKTMPLTLRAPVSLAHSWCAFTALSKQPMQKNAPAK